jgi:hypothetical protein
MTSSEEAMGQPYGELEAGAQGSPTRSDIAHWIEVYAELAEFTQGLMSRVDSGPLVAQLQRRLDFYQRRLGEWTAVGAADQIDG